MRSIAVLGSTGSIGSSTLQVARHLKDKIRVRALAALGNIDLLEKQIREFHPEVVAVYDEAKAAELKARGVDVEVLVGPDGMDAVASLEGVDCVVMAIVGLKALAPTVAAIRSGKSLALASKEVLVSAGALVMNMAKRHNVPVIPIDSEHSALFQCLEGERKESVGRLVLTASGGPFRTATVEELEQVTVKKALCHPTWQMGPKITIDSSTLMNKGLEIIEAHFLFDIPVEKIEVVIHPQSIIHSLVEYVDGAMLAALSIPTMLLPIQYAITYPERVAGLLAPFDFAKNDKLEFFAPDFTKFPSLGLAYEALRTGGSVPCYLNAANEVLVERFLREELSWRGIAHALQKLLDRHNPEPADSLEAIFSIDAKARREAWSV